MTLKSAKKYQLQYLITILATETQKYKQQKLGKNKGMGISNDKLVRLRGRRHGYGYKYIYYMRIRQGTTGWERGSTGSCTSY